MFDSRSEVRIEFHSLPAAATAVVVFVHGLDGNPFAHWGASEHPGALITRVAADLPAVAIAALDYPCTLRRIAADPDLCLENLARQCAASIDEHLAGWFADIAFVSHCFGGLLATTSLRLLDEAQRGGRHPRRRVCLIQLDVPFCWPVPGPSDWLAGLFEALGVRPQTLERNVRFWREHVIGPTCHGDRTSTTKPEPDGRPAIEAFSLVTVEPGWTSAMLPEAELPSDRIRVVPLHHTEILDVPDRGPFPTHDFVIETLRSWIGAG